MEVLKKHYWIAALAVLILGGWVGTKLFFSGPSRQPMQEAEESPENVVEKLIADLNDENHSVRFQAAMQLDDYKNNPKVAQALLSFVSNADDVAERNMAVKSLASQESPDVTEALFTIADTEVEPEVRVSAAKILLNRGDFRAIEILMKLARKAQDEHVRSQAVIELGGYTLRQDLRVRKMLLSALKDPEPRVQGFAASGLIYHEGPAVTEAVFSMANSTYDAGAKYLAAQCLAYRGDMRSVDILISSLKIKTHDAGIRRGAAIALGMRAIRQDPRVEPALSSVLNDGDVELREYARRSLEDIQRDKKRQ